MSKRVPPPIKYHGGLYYQAPKLLKLFPPRESYDHFVDGCVGGGSVLFAHDPKGKAEIANDLSGNLSNLWRVIADPDLFQEFGWRISKTPFCQRVWLAATDELVFDPSQPHWLDWPAKMRVDKAIAYFVLARQSLAGRHGKNPVFAAVTKTRLRAGMNEQVSAWWSAVKGLPKVAERLSRVLVLNQDVDKLVADWDKPRVLIYLDPPWLCETRDAPDVYEHEMTPEDHERLLNRLVNMRQASVIISGRRCEMYESLLRGWRAVDIQHKSSSGGGKTKKTMTHTVWMNYRSPAIEGTWEHYETVTFK